MFDPISTLFYMWVMNVGLPPARLDVTEVIKVREERIIIKTIVSSIELRDGI